MVLPIVLLGLFRLTAATQAAQGNEGLQGGWAVDDAGNTTFNRSLQNDLPLIQQAGAGWVRINFRLGACFADWTSLGCNGKTALQSYEPLVAAAAENHLQVLGLLSNESWKGSPKDWKAKNAEHNPGGNGDNAYAQNFATSAAGVLAAHFNGVNGALISQWEVWNEPNAWTSNPRPGVYRGGTFIYPSNFAWLLTHAYAAIKAANSNAVVISGGLYAHDTSATGAAAVRALHSTDTETVIPGGIYFHERTWRIKHGAYSSSRRSSCSSTVATSGADYFCSTYAQGIQYAGWTGEAYPFDQVGQHLYINQFGRTSSSNLTAFLQDLRDAYLVYEGASTTKQIQVTEVGWSTANVSRWVQARNLRIAYTVFRNTSYVERAYWFFIQDIPEAPLYYGLIDPNGTLKRAFAFYQTYATYH